MQRGEQAPEAKEGLGLGRVLDDGNGGQASMAAGASKTVDVEGAAKQVEYALGSTIYLVYTRSQDRHLTGTAAPRTLSPDGLLQAPASDALLMKWSYYFSR